MNPLLNEYTKRVNSTHRLTAKNARNLLLASIHEAGHWFAFAHFKVPVTSAYVQQSGNGRVTPADYCGYVVDDLVPEVDYVASLAGPAASCALIPFDSAADVRASAFGDKLQCKQLLDRVIGDNRTARKLFVDDRFKQTEQLIADNWQLVEALAYELMKNGKFHVYECQNIEKRYGVGRLTLSPARVKSARDRLSDFNSSPSMLVAGLIAI